MFFRCRSRDLMPCSLRCLLAGSGKSGKLDAIFNAKALRKGWFSASLTKMASSSLVEINGWPGIAWFETLFSINNLAHLLAFVNGTPIVLAALDAEWPVRMRSMTCECSCCLSAILKRNGKTNRQWCQRPIVKKTIPWNWKFSFQKKTICWLDLEFKEKNSILVRDLNPGL